MRKLAWIITFTLMLSLFAGCHPSSVNSETGDDVQLAKPTDPSGSDDTKPEETTPDPGLPQNPTLSENTSADPQLDIAILKSYCDLTGSDFLTEGADMQVRHFAQIGDIYAVYVDGPWMYTQAIRNVTVFGFNFIFPDGQRMHLYRDGEICAVDDAETESFATKDEIQVLWSVYQEKTGNRYGNGSVTE